MPPAFQATATFSPPFAAHDTAPRWWLPLLARFVRSIPGEALDRSTGLYNRNGLFAAVDEAMRTRPADASAAMVVLDFTDLREVRQIYGHVIARKLVARIVRRLRSLAGSRGLVGRTGPTQFTVVFPGMGEDKAILHIQRVLGKPARVEFDAGDSEIVLVPDLIVDEAGSGEHAVQDLYRGMCRDLARHQKEELRRLNFLTSERERHSRPMSVPSH
jgi:diguanylate cyclase (GGDEF)-like protein